MEGSKACMETRQEFKLLDVTSGLGKGMKILAEAEPSNGEEKGARIPQVEELEGRLLDVG